MLIPFCAASHDEYFELCFKLMYWDTYVLGATASLKFSIPLLSKDHFSKILMHATKINNLERYNN